MAVVTLSGQIGTGAREVGRLVADRLQIDYVDQEILVQAAGALGVSMESVVSLDERTATLGERLAGMLRRFLERSAAAGATDPMLAGGGLDVLLGRSYAEAAADEGLLDVSDERYVATLNGIVRDLAGHGNVLIIGRGSQVILSDWPGACHVLLVGPLDERVRLITEREGLEKEAAAKRVHDGDKGRAAFHHRFFRVDVDQPWLYDLTLNTARLPLEEAAEVIGEVAMRIAAKAQPREEPPSRG